MKRLVAWLLFALSLFSAGAWPATLYVSNAAVNGIPIGNDSTGTGSIAAPWLTVDKFVSSYTAGDTLMVNCGTYTHASTNWFFNKSVIVSPVSDVDDCAVLKATSGNQVIVLNAASAVYTFNRITLDGQQSQIYAMSAQDNATTYTVTLNDTTLKNATQHQFTAVGASNKLNLTMNRVKFTNTGGTSRTCAFLGGVIAGSVSIVDPTCNITQQNVDTYGGFVLLGAAASIPISVTESAPGGCSVHVTIPSGGSGGQFRYGVQIINGKPGLIKCSDITADDSGSAKTFYLAHISPSTTSPQDTSGAQIIDTTINASVAAGIAAIIGRDGTTGADTHHDDSTVARVTVNGTARSETGQFHGVLMGYSANQVIDRVKVSRTYLGAALKGSTGASYVRSSIFSQFKGYAVTTRGTNGATVANNSMYWPDTNYQAAYCFYNWADGSTISTGNVWKNNACRSDVALANGILISETGSDFTGDRNAYSAPGPYPSGMWQNGGNSYATAALWLAAGRETSLNEVNPNFPAAANGDFYVRAPRLKRAGVAVSGVTTDYAGVAYLDPPTVGALQSHATQFRRKAQR